MFSSRLRLFLFFRRLEGERCAYTSDYRVCFFFTQPSLRLNEHVFFSYNSYMYVRCARYLILLRAKRENNERQYYYCYYYLRKNVPEYSSCDRDVCVYKYKMHVAIGLSIIVVKYIIKICFFFYYIISKFATKSRDVLSNTKRFCFSSYIPIIMRTSRILRSLIFTKIYGPCGWALCIIISVFFFFNSILEQPTKTVPKSHTDPIFCQLLHKLL